MEHLFSLRIIPRMKIGLYILPFAVISAVILAIPNSQAAPEFLDPVLRSLAELPLVVGTVWLVLRLQEKQSIQTEKIISAFSERAERKDNANQQLVDELLGTIRELTKHSPHQ